MICRTCNGTGRIAWGLASLLCAYCSGTGKLHGPRAEPEERGLERFQRRVRAELDELYRDTGGEAGSA